jgi:hypothetical protein
LTSQRVAVYTKTLESILTVLTSQSSFPPKPGIRWGQLDWLNVVESPLTVLVNVVNVPTGTVQSKIIGLAFK